MLPARLPLLLAFLLPRWLEEREMGWTGEWSPSFLEPSQKKERNAKKKKREREKERKKEKKLLSRPLWKHGPQYSTMMTTQGTTPRCCLVFQRHLNVIYNFAQLLIWFVTQSRTGTFKVGVNRQLSPGRHFAPGGLS